MRRDTGRPSSVITSRIMNPSKIGAIWQGRNGPARAPVDGRPGHVAVVEAYASGVGGRFAAERVDQGRLASAAGARSILMATAAPPQARHG